MKILTIDTSSEVCSVALLEDDKLIDKNELDNGKTHSETLMVLIDELFKRNNVDIKDINLFGCDVGPGSFTGIRIGVSTIKAMAEVLNVKIASVTSLEVLARNVQDRKIIASIIDARNDQVYLGIFDEKVVHLPADLVAPQMGWNCFENGKYQGKFVYFCNSFYVPVCKNTTAFVDYFGTKISAIIQKNNFTGMQFHPEKSGKVGEKILADWLEKI